MTSTETGRAVYRVRLEMSGGIPSGPPLRELTVVFERPTGARVAGEMDRRG